MAWNPETYNKFKSERFTPFYDLLELVHRKPGLSVLDLGCGTGVLTKKLADVLPDSFTIGVDSSEEMLKESRAFASPGLRFAHISIEDQLEKDQKFDLIFSNAAFQWVEDHATFLPKIISKIKPGGQLLIQMPAQNHNISNRLLNELAIREPFKTALNGFTRTSPVLDIDEYAQILYQSRARLMTVFEKVYPLTLQDSASLYEWVSGTAIIPFLERLDDEFKDDFINEYKTLLHTRFSRSPVFYPFKRIIIEASF